MLTRHPALLTLRTLRTLRRLCHPCHALLAAGFGLLAIADSGLGAGLVIPVAHAQATVIRDAQWRYAVGAGASIASGNSESKQLSFSGDAVSARADDKFTLSGKLLRVSGQGVTQSDQLSAAMRYERDFSKRWFGFGEFDGLRDRPANLQLRLGSSLGVGFHLVQAERNSFDVFTGIGYLDNRYYQPVVVADLLRANYSHLEYLIGEESRTRMTDSTSFNQKLTFYQNMRNTGSYRAVLDAGLSVAIDNRFSLNASIAWRYNSDPGSSVPGFNLPGVSPARRDFLFVTGLTLKFD